MEPLHPDNDRNIEDITLDEEALLASLASLLETPTGMPLEEIPPEEDTPSAPIAKRFRPNVLCAVIAGLLVVFLGIMLFFQTRPMPDQAHIGSVDVSGLTVYQASKALRQHYGSRFTDTDMVITLPDCTITLPAEKTKAKLHISAAVNAARKATSPCTQSILPYLGLDEEYIQGELEEYASRFSCVYVPSGYILEGEAPDVSAQGFREDAPCQSVVLTIGTPGFSVDTDRLYGQILDAYAQGEFQVTAQETQAETTPEKLNITAIYKATRLAPQEPYVDLEKHQVVPGQHGYELDLADARKQLAAADYGDTLRLNLHYTAPEIADEDAFFQDVLGKCETPHSNNENRNTNLRIACEALNGIILEPGQTISYNEALGERTADKGYQPAPAYSGTRLVNSLGGGICQVSSTLYLASVYAELTIVERVNHGYPVSYIPLGMDATVNWGSTDLKLCNDSPMPVKIQAEESDGYVRIAILGTETRDYDIEMTYSVGGRYVRTYMSKFDKQTGELISKEPYALSSYLEDIYKY